MNALELRNVSKRFGSIQANKGINLKINYGEILAILGENGSGKTTLMNIIAGIYHPDEGEIFINGNPAYITSPKDSINFGIGMIHQHFKLVDVFSATENIVLGYESEEKYNLKKSEAKVAEISEKYGFGVDPKKKIYSMSVSEKQTVEIIKVLYKGAEILILDEPTAVLTPQETDKLFNVLRNMRDDGKAIVIITHKLREVMEVSDKVAILRRGEYIDTVKTSETNEAALTEMMVGRKISLNIDRPAPHDCTDRLIVKGLDMYRRDGFKILDDISFTAKSGEILGIAGIAGSGQRELLESIAGLHHNTGGDIIYNDPFDKEMKNLREKTPVQIRELGVRLSFVPEDRLGMGLVGNMNLIDNMLLRTYNKGKSAFLDRQPSKELAEDIVKKLSVVTPGVTTPVRKLSGGNVQKVLVGREIASSPTVLMCAYPVRGLDINSSYLIYNLLNEQKEKGTAVIFVGEDLDVLMELCDRLMVINSGRITGIVDPRQVTKDYIGTLMTEGGRRNG